MSGLARRFSLDGGRSSQARGATAFAAVALAALWGSTRAAIAIAALSYATYNPAVARLTNRRSG